MEVKIQHKQNSIQANIEHVNNSGTWLLFIAGGSLEKGRYRYYEWQNILIKKHINTLSFDHAGIGGSTGTKTTSSLADRIKETEKVLTWLTQHYYVSKIHIFASSMGGYVALGLHYLICKKIDKIILFAPAAYSKKAHTLKFDSTFTNEIRQQRSWRDSLSYEWMDTFQKPILLLIPEKDDIIPTEITHKYKQIIARKNNAFSETLFGCKHDCWGDTVEEKRHRQDIFIRTTLFLHKTES